MNPELPIATNSHYHLQQATVGWIADSVLDISFAKIEEQVIKLFIYIKDWEPYAYHPLLKLQQNLVEAVPSYELIIQIEPLSKTDFREMQYERLWHPLFVRTDEDF